MARWFLGGELVGGEIPWWRDDIEKFELAILSDVFASVAS